jgi:hypothetical protein
VHVIPVSHGGSIGKFGTIKMHSVLLNNEMSNGIVSLPCVSLDAATNRTPLCIFIVLFEPALLDGSVNFSS